MLIPFLLIRLLDEHIDLIGNGSQTLSPEVGLGQVDAGDARHMLDCVHGSGLEQLTVLGQECLALIHNSYDTAAVITTERLQ